MIVETKMRYNATTEEVELVYGEEVAMTSSPEVFKSWVEAYNSAHPLEPVIVEVPAPPAEVNATTAEELATVAATPPEGPVEAVEETNAEQTS